MSRLYKCIQVAEKFDLGFVEGQYYQGGDREVSCDVCTVGLTELLDGSFVAFHVTSQTMAKFIEIK